MELQCMLQFSVFWWVNLAHRNANKSGKKNFQPVNNFNELIFIVLWFWLLVVSALNLLNLLYWSYITFHSNRKHYFIHLLSIHGIKCDEHFLPFYQNYLFMDVATMFRLIQCNISVDTVSKCLALFYNSWKAEAQALEETLNARTSTPLSIELD